MRILRHKKIFSLVVICIGIVLVVCNVLNIKKDHVTQCVDISKLEEYEKNSKDRYIVAIMLNKCISYDEAKRLEEQNMNDIDISEDQNICYATVEKTIGNFFDGKSSMTVAADIEIRYVYENKTGQISYLEPVMIVYIPNISDRVYRFSAGECNVYEMDDAIRISETVISDVEAEENEKSNLITSVLWSEKDKAYIATKVQTYSTKVLYSELQ